MLLFGPDSRMARQVADRMHEHINRRRDDGRRRQRHDDPIQHDEIARAAHGRAILQIAIDRHNRWMAEAHAVGEEFNCEGVWQRMQMRELPTPPSPKQPLLPSSPSMTASIYFPKIPGCSIRGMAFTIRVLLLQWMSEAELNARSVRGAADPLCRVPQLAPRRP
jgi:hypothetical protein